VKDDFLDDIIAKIDSLRIEECESGAIIRKPEVSDFKRPSLLPKIINMRSLLVDSSKS
jgi:hypothetical protein